MSTSFTVLVTGSPTHSQAHLSAIRFIEAAAVRENIINNVFFYQDAVVVANRFLCPPQDETQLTDKWAELAKDNGFELQVCVAASNRRGVISEEESRLNGLSDDSLHPSFSVLGLGQLAASMSKTENKLIHFK